MISNIIPRLARTWLLAAAIQLILSNLEQTLSLSGATLTISGAGGKQADLSALVR